MTTKKHISFFRLVISLLVFAAFCYGGFWGFQKIISARAASNLAPWFAPYVDVTATPHFAFESLEAGKTTKNVVLAFVVSSPEDPCTPTWGGAYSLDAASSKLDLDRRIARFYDKGGNVTVSFGGQRNSELAVLCTDKKELKKAYLEVIERYNLDTVDMDLEGEGLSNKEALRRRFKVLSEIQKELKSQKRNLAIWLTLPVSTNGLSPEGTDTVALALSSGLDLAGVNAMTMDYGQSRDKSQSMLEASEEALSETHRQLRILFGKAGINLNEDSVWAKIGATPMIGQNDIAGEIFSLEDASKLNEFASSHGMVRLSIWSLNRDVPCGENYVHLDVVSDSCSGVKQEKFAFSVSLGQNFDGQISGNASATTSPDPKKKPTPDDPSKSPYQIWDEEGVYLEGTKVVWHHNVYEAKWWTKGDLPDNPVLQSWQTPWQLVGPVLPGEKPIPQPTLPVGTFPSWKGDEEYDAGQIVLLNGVPYRAKWWTQGDSPAASSSNPDGSPWIPLTQEQVNELSNQPIATSSSQESSSAATIAQ